LKSHLEFYFFILCVQGRKRKASGAFNGVTHMLWSTDQTRALVGGFAGLDWALWSKRPCLVTSFWF